MQNVIAVILAGGRGTRLEPLTRDRAKPAVPFGGAYRIVDFTLSNCLNSGVRKLLMLTQYKAMSLDQHVNYGWRNYFCHELGEFIDVVPPQQRIDEQWYQGTADAVYQNIYALEKSNPQQVLILSGDHIYKMNYRKMVEFHNQSNADLTVAALEVDRETGKQFGIMQVDTQGRIIGFEEKPDQPQPLPGKPHHCMASMGIYVFNARFLFEQLLRDANDSTSSHDFGKNIIPSIIDSARVFAFPFKDENQKSQSYWRDVGTIDAYYEANMDLISVDPMLNMYDRDWPIRTKLLNFPPPKFVFSEQEAERRVGLATDSIVCQGSVVSGGRVERSIIGPEVRINSFSHIEDSIIFDRVNIGRHCRIRNAIIDKNVDVPAGTEIGFDQQADRARGFTISPSGIVVIGKSALVQSNSTLKPNFTTKPNQIFGSIKKATD